jgi:hypothetical protein
MLINTDNRISNFLYPPCKGGEKKQDFFSNIKYIIDIRINYYSSFIIRVDIVKELKKKNYTIFFPY